MSSVFGICGRTEGSFPAHSKAKYQKNKRTKYYAEAHWVPGDLDPRPLNFEQIAQYVGIHSGAEGACWAPACAQLEMQNDGHCPCSQGTLSSACLRPPHRILGQELIVNFNFCIKTTQEGFPGGSVVENPPANAGDTGSIPDWADHTGRRAAKPVHRSYQLHAREPGSCDC